MIVDCHTHWGRYWRGRDGEYSSRFLAVLDKHGVDVAFLMPEPGITRLDCCASDNDSVLDQCLATPDRLVPIVTSWPQLGDAGLSEITRCAERGARGLKFHPWLQGFSTSDPVFARMCETAAKLGLPVFFHDGTPPYALSEQVAGLALRFPETTFVLGHCGLLWNWRSALDAASLPNVYSCLCGPHLRATEILCTSTDPDRLLWGSDFGFGQADRIGYLLDLIRTANMPDSIRNKALGENAVGLLNRS
jgi:uncharacterized protein